MSKEIPSANKSHTNQNHDDRRRSKSFFVLASSLCLSLLAGLTELQQAQGQTIQEEAMWIYDGTSIPNMNQGSPVSASNTFNPLSFPEYIPYINQPTKSPQIKGTIPFLFLATLQVVLSAPNYALRQGYYRDINQFWGVKFAPEKDRPP